jgi:ribosomal protein S18 acetylase RimI-like enzyme
MNVRPAHEADLPQLGTLAGALVRFHHVIDPQRFLLPDRVEEGYRWWLGKELVNPEAVLVVAEDPSDATVVGYAYGRMQERDWNALLDACGALHDVWVEPSHRRHGLARALITAVIDALTAKGAPRVVLSTATSNHGAQALFSSLGFRSTMIEMTREAVPAR